MGFVTDDLCAGEDEAEMRQATISACMDALRKSNDPTVRADALKRLTDLQHLKVIP